MALSFKFTANELKDSAGFDFIITYKNLTNDSIYVIKSLVHGNLHTPYANVTLQIQQLKKSIYTDVLRPSAEALLYGYDDTDSLFYSGIEKIGPRQSKILKINLVETFWNIEQGKYRVRIHLMKISENTFKKFSAEYVVSKYFYFEIKSAISRRFIPLPGQ